MSHNITQRADRTVEAMFAYQPAWHGLGTVVQGAPTGAEAMRLAHLDWTVEKRPLYRSGKDAVEYGAEQIDSHVELVRTDSNAPLGVVSRNYGEVQNVEAFGILDQLAQDGVVKYESAFSMHGGKHVVLLARLPGEFEALKGDVVLPYIMLSTRHDGGGSLYLCPTAVRVVCNNTWSMAVGAAEAAAKAGEPESWGFYKLRHTSNVKANAEQAAKAIGKTLERMSVVGAASSAMAQRAISSSELASFIDELLPLPQPVKTNGDKNPAFERVIREKSIVRALFHKSPTVNLPGAQGTVWAAFNALTEYVDHQADLGKGSDTASKSESAFRVKAFGTGAALKALAFDKALALVS